MREGIARKEAIEKENGRTQNRNFLPFSIPSFIFYLTLLCDSVKELAGMKKQKQDIM